MGSKYTKENRNEHGSKLNTNNVKKRKEKVDC